MADQVIVAMSGNLTLYVALPEGNGSYRTLRCRATGRNLGVQEAEFRGRIGSVEELEGEESMASVVRCGTVLLSLSGEPETGRRMGVGIAEGQAAEVSSRLAWRIELEADRAWVAEPLMRAYRNGDRRWQEMLAEQPYEQGNEGLEDAEMQAEALDAYYQRRLETIAKRRQRKAERQGFGLKPVVVPVSNEDLAEALELAPGEGMKKARVPLRDRVAAGRVAAGIDRMLAAVKRFGEETAAEELPMAA